MYNFERSKVTNYEGRIKINFGGYDFLFVLTNIKLLKWDFNWFYVMADQLKIW